MDFKLKILYEDKDILAIDKQAGISVHGDGRNDVETLADLILKEYPEMKNVGEPMEIEVNGEIKKIFRPGIVHRLDKDTSGVLLLARNQNAYEFLKKQFQNREIKKTYITLVSGHMKNDTGTIDASIGRSPSDPRKRIASRGKSGKLRDAVTEYKVLERIEIDGEKYTWVEVYPKTGRTHQIRVHMKFLNHPVVCDKLYASDKNCPESISRLALHAKSIEFKNLAGENLKIEAPISEDLKSINK
ncbi:MAG: RluA family pseudouridine synthase [Candidatus Pacebacteria bacterium]|jgi:23S rRNA pseudouridine1911/1915/1917 synthase|nr:RluA family pseudouridine synthase [Candidatus Paceibacterota bacterium]